MILQIDHRLAVDPAWEDDGCALISCFWWVNVLTNYPFDIEGILFFGDSFRKHGLVEKDFTILNWEGVLNFFPGMHVRYHNRHDTPDVMCGPDEFEILEWYNPETKYHHYTAGNGRGYVTYDPMGRSVTVRDGFLQSKRIFREG